ncbi:MAG TPA: hypothetical protein DDZ96_12610 [Porphyromonadaceae bacterium]|jgi:RNA polymerase sigma factor (sigma-70 family)|nr:hypothetical protein [Porphyromonadaceae bacterium]HBX21745.1 hypothetical protein [Porphyromonadaceae bacterium]HCM19743.1 hypothetical protein [Porphyromonadaceae bacterium]
MKQEQINDLNLLLELLRTSSSEKLQRQAFEKLFHFYWKPLRGYAEPRVADEDIDDMLQDMFSFFWIHRQGLLAEKIKNKKDLEKWLMDFVRSKAANIRKQKTKRVGMDDENFRQEIDNKTVLKEEQIYFVERQGYEKMLLKIVDTLPPDLRLVYSLKRKYGYPVERIATYMQLTEMQVKEKFRKAKAVVEEKILQTYKIEDLL